MEKHRVIAYKLLRVRKNGTLGPLFICQRMHIVLDLWMLAGFYPTKGYAQRKGWHCTLKPIAPHLTTKGRRWYKVEVEDTEMYNRPESQGGTWVLAQRMKVICPV